VSPIVAIKEQLDAKLKNIYTYADGKQFDIRVELQNLEQIENVYSVIESDGVKEGSVYQEYNGFLSKVRERIVFLKDKMDGIEKANASDIKNINLLLEKMKWSS
jgi:uncharacterized protein (UPF0335 family)